MGANNFHLLRILAAIQVLVRHSVAFLGVEDSAALKLLAAVPGVPIFFVISGYLVSASLERAPTVKRYFWYRALRIYPALWVCLAVSILVAYLNGVSFDSPQTAPWIAAQMTFVQFFNPDFLREYGVGVLNGPLWTISVELQFYVLLPLIYAVTKRNAVLIASIIALAAFQCVFAAMKLEEETTAIKILGITALPYLYLFLLGVVLQRNRGFVKRHIEGHFIRWAAVFVATSGLLWLTGATVTGNDLNPLSAATLGIMVIAAAHARPVINLRHDLSYGVYIYHMLFINALVHAGVTGWSALAITMSGALCAAALSWFLIERPALSLKAISYPLAPSRSID